MEIKGIITIDKYPISLTCCDNVKNILIDGNPLYDVFDSKFNQDAEEHWENYEGISVPPMSMRYVILDEAPEIGTTFDNLAAKVIIEQLYCEHVSGCYSEWTCGHGGFDYVMNGGHSIFNELASYEGKYVHMIM